MTAIRAKNRLVSQKLEMEPKMQPSPRRINEIETLWPVLAEAHGEEGFAAKQAILERYRPAVYRYLLACVSNEDAANELCQEFSLRFVRGDFRNATPEKGRFRDLLKSALYHLVIDYHKRRQREMPQISPNCPEPADSLQSTYDSDKQFLATWRKTLLNKAWDILKEEEEETQRPVFSVLHFRAEHPDQRAPELAQGLTEKLGKAVSPDWVRKWLHIGRDKFANILLREVRDSLQDQSPDAVEQELLDVGLYEYCKAALATWRERLEEANS